MVDDHYREQVRLLLAILPIVAKQSCFALKGGTAINLFVRELPRLSVDIDLTYLPVESRPVSLKGIQNAMQAISREAKTSLRNEYPKIKVRGSTAGVKQASKLVLQSEEVQVKIEPNTILRGSVYRPERRSIVTAVKEGWGQELDATVLSVPDLYGGKICAALDRQHPRDLFDIKMLYESEGITDEIRKAFVVYLSGHNRPIGEILNPNLKDLNESFEREFKGMAFREVTCDELAAARVNLISDVQSNLSDSERRFLLSVKEGFPNWDLLALPGIEQLPSIKWKLANIRKLPKRKHTQLIEDLKKVLGL